MALTGTTQNWLTTGTLNCYDLTCHNIDAVGYDIRTGNFVIEGGTYDINLYKGENITAERNITFPNMSGSVALTGTGVSQDWLTTGDLSANNGTFEYIVLRDGAELSVIRQDGNWIEIDKGTGYGTTINGHVLAGSEAVYWKPGLNAAKISLEHSTPTIYQKSIRLTGSAVAFSMFDLYVENNQRVDVKQGVIGFYGNLNQGSTPTPNYIFMGATTTTAYNNAIFKIDAEDRVGIGLSGTTRPAYLLEVGGDTKIGENLSVGAGAPSAGFAGEGDIYATSGIKAMEGLYSEAVAYGAGLEIADNAQTTSYTNAMYGDATMVGATRTITDTHADFGGTDDVNIGDFFKVISSTPSFTGATGEILDIPNSTTLVLGFGTSAEDTIPDASAMSFVVYPHPRFFAGDNGDFHASVGINDDASFKIIAEDLNNDHALHVVATAGVAGVCGIDLEMDPQAFGGVSGCCLKYDATAFAAGTLGTGYNIVVDNVNATGGDFHGIDVAVSDPSNTDIEVVAVGTNEGVDVIHQHLGEPSALAAGFSYDTDTYNDRTAAFGDSGTNVGIFSLRLDYVYLASLTKFDQINVLLDTPGDRTIRPTFEYSVADGTWVEFTPADDTIGFQQNGTIRFSSDDLTTWGQRTVNEVTGEAGAVDYYWVRIKRGRWNLPNPPIESEIQVTTTGTFYSWDKTGNVSARTLAVTDGITAPSTISGQAIIYVDSADGDLKVKFGDGTVKTIVTD